MNDQKTDSQGTNKVPISRATTNFIIDSTGFLCVALLASTGLLIHYILPPGSGRNSVWDLTRHQWGDIHFYIALTFLGALLVHLVLHLKWVVRMINGNLTENKRRRCIAMAVLLSLSAMIAALFFSPVSVSNQSGESQHRGWQQEE